MEFFEKMGVYKRVLRTEIKRLGGKMITTRWIDTDKGHMGKPKYRSRMVGREIKKDKRQGCSPPRRRWKH